jgi:hypothetical protein
MDKLPKDLAAAKRAYEAFNEEQPNIWFEDLAPHYQMRWVRAIRAAVEENKNYNGPGRSPDLTEHKKHGDFWDDLGHLPKQEFLDKWVPKKKGRYQYQVLEPEQRKEALRVAKSITNQKWSIKRTTKTK